MKKSFLKKLRQEAIIKTIILALLTGIIALTFYEDNKEERYTDMFIPRCTVKTKEDIEKCWTTNRYVTINTNKIYSTEFVYTENDEERAYYIDIDIDGKSLIAVVSKIKAEKLLNSEGPYIIEGHLDNDTKNEEMFGGKWDVVKAYQDQLETEEDKAWIRTNTIDGILNEYKGQKSENALIIIVYIALLIVFSIYLIKNFYHSLNIRNIKLLKGYTDLDIEILEKEYTTAFENKKIFTTKHFFFQKGILSSSTAKLSDISWVYERSVRHYGFEVNRPLIINTKNKNTIHVQCKKEVKEQLIKTIVDQTENLLVGYTTENIKEYKIQTK